MQSSFTKYRYSTSSECNKFHFPSGIKILIITHFIKYLSANHITFSSCIKLKSPSFIVHLEIHLKFLFQLIVIAFQIFYSEHILVYISIFIYEEVNFPGMTHLAEMVPVTIIQTFSQPQDMISSHDDNHTCCSWLAPVDI